MAAVEKEAQKGKKHKAKNTEPREKNKKSNEAKAQLQHQEEATAAITPSANNNNNNSNNNENKKRKRKEVFPFGNYKSYYGYRIDPESDEDPRLKVLKKEWFHGKDCLDIGCNSGVITIQIAKKFQCRSILGVDIDHNRIEDARWHLRKFVRVDNDTRARATKSELSGRVNGLEHRTTKDTKENPKDSSPSKTRNLFDIVSFQQENFIQSRHPPEKHYDAILCLSITKWIHLNWGDDGLITLFTKIWRLLRPGGILILEPQPWKSYESNHLVSEATQMNYHNIMLRPEYFQEILLDKIGFRMVEDLSSDLSGSKAGFNRPIFALHK